MKTAITREIDNITVVTGVSHLIIDPVETAKHTAGMLESTKEYKAQMVRKRKCKTLISQMSTQQKNIVNVIKVVAARNQITFSDAANEKSLFTSRERENFRNADSLYKRMTDELNQEYEELKACAAPVKKAKRKIVIQNAVYFDTRHGEIEISDEQEAEFVALLNQRDALKKEKKIPHYVTLDKRILPDLRGKKYYLPVGNEWPSFEVTDFGEHVDDNAIFEDDLTAEQRKAVHEYTENLRIEAMSEEEKLLEIDGLKSGLMAQARDMKANLEIEGSTATKASKDSKDWFDSEVASLMDKYGVN